MNAMIAAASVPLLLATLAAADTWRRVRAATEAQSAGAEADAIVVMGAAVSVAGPCPELRARLEHAARLYRRGWAPTVLCAGGRSAGRSEAQVMMSALERMGVSSGALIADERSVNTRRAAEAVRRLSEARGWSRVLIVTSPYHVHRAVRETRRHGLVALASAPSETPLTRKPTTLARHTLREVLAVLWYSISRGRADRRAPA